MPMRCVQLAAAMNRLISLGLAVMHAAASPHFSLFITRGSSSSFQKFTLHFSHGRRFI